VWPCGLQNIEVVLSAGYDFSNASQAAEVADIVAAALDLAKSTGRMECRRDRSRP
jgi:hypothetical protein